MLREKSAREYQTITSTLFRDLTLLHNRFPDAVGFSEAVGNLMGGYAAYYRRHNIGITLTGPIFLPSLEPNMPDHPQFSFIEEDGEHFIFITGTLPDPFALYRLDYLLDITADIESTQNVGRILLGSSVAFSVLAAVALYFILHKIFRPLELVASASRHIADGQYKERIHLKGKHELAKVAAAFNQMADQVETNIQLLEEDAERKQQFVDSFAHEIRTPLTSIYGYAEYLQKASLAENELIESAGYIRNEAMHMRELANSLLELATFRGYQPTKISITIPELFDDIRQTLEGALHAKGARLSCDYTISDLEGQADLIKALLLNLCQNALAACEPDKGEIHLNAFKEDEQITLSVRDNGRGIPEESLSKITEPFYRVDKARSRTEGGAGIGLTLCQQIADVHGAQLLIESQLGVGTTVKIIFTSS